MPGICISGQRYRKHTTTWRYRHKREPGEDRQNQGDTSKSEGKAWYYQKLEEVKEISLRAEAGEKSSADTLILHFWLPEP